MTGLHRSLVSTCIQGVVSANRHTLLSAVGDVVAREPRYGKSDTIGIDAIAETAIARTIQDFDVACPHFSEECSRNCGEVDIVFGSDPCDGSKPIRAHLEAGTTDPSQRVLDIIRLPDNRQRWEAAHQSPATVTSSCFATSVFRHGVPVGTAVFNIISQDLVVACEAGVFLAAVPEELWLKQPERITLDWVISHGRPVCFLPAARRHPAADSVYRFVTYLEKPPYRDNLQRSDLLRHAQLQRMTTGDTNGPDRPLFLSELHDRHGPSRVDLVIANGEKFSEWGHWLAFCRFARWQGAPALSLFEVTPEHPVAYTDGTCMAPPLRESVFQMGGDGTRIDFRRLARRPKPNTFRSTLVLAAADDKVVSSVMQRHGYRQVLLAG